MSDIAHFLYVIGGVLVYFVEPIDVVVIEKGKVSGDQEGSVELGELELTIAKIHFTLYMKIL